MFFEANSGGASLLPWNGRTQPLRGKGRMRVCGKFQPSRGAPHPTSLREATFSHKREKGAPLLYILLNLLAFSLFVPPALAQSPPLPVVASFSILGDFVREVGGSGVEVSTIVGFFFIGRAAGSSAICARAAISRGSVWVLGGNHAARPFSRGTGERSPCVARVG